MFVIQGYSQACSKASIRAHAHLDGGIGLRPGGNVTGIAILMEETTSKRFQLLRVWCRKRHAWRLSGTPLRKNNWKEPMSRRASWGALVEFLGEHGGRTAGCV